MGFIKKLIKLLLILLLLVAGFCVLVFLLEKSLTFLENKFGKNEKDIVTTASDTFYKDKNSSINNEDLDSNGTQGNKEGKDGDSQDGGNNGNNKTDGKEITYSPFNLDDVILLYEGKQKGTRVKGLLDRLIENTNQTLYSYVKVTAFGTSIVFENADIYVAELNSLKSSIDDNSFYNISFGYNATSTVANEVIIEKASN